MDSILTAYKENWQDILEKFIGMMTIMASSEQLNINTAEEAMKLAMADIKIFMLSLSGTLLSSDLIKSKQDVICPCCKNKIKSTKRDSKINILTILGNMKIKRDLYSCRNCGISVGKNDTLLEIFHDHRVTKGLAELVAHSGQLFGSFEEAGAAIEKYLGLKISVPQYKTITEEIGKMVFENDKKKAEEIYKNIDDLKNNAQTNYSENESAKTMYVLADGSMINTREKNKEAKSLWREIKLGLIFNAKTIQAGVLPMLSEKEYVSYLGNVETFKKMLVSTALKHNFNSRTKVIALADGAPYLWTMFEELFPGCIEILDFYHFSENVNKYATFLYPNDEVSKKRWINEIIELSLKNKSEDILAKIKRDSPQSKPKDVVNLYDYVEKNKLRITYGEFKEKGYIIGSGAIEGGNKCVIQKRLKQSGMHWSPQGAQYVATLRTKYKSNLWSDVIHIIENEYMSA
jgi:hypothetical protein